MGKGSCQRTSPLEPAGLQRQNKPISRTVAHMLQAPWDSDKQTECICSPEDARQKQCCQDTKIT